MAKKATKKKPYHVYLEINGQKYEAEGDTLDEALVALPAIYPKTKGVLSVEENGVLKKPRLFFINQLRRLSYPGLTGQIQRAAIIKRLMV
jgi:hypothetical protein